MVMVMVRVRVRVRVEQRVEHLVAGCGLGDPKQKPAYGGGAF